MDYIVLKNPRYKNQENKINNEVNTDSEDFINFLNEFEDFFKEIELNLYTLSKNNINNYIFKIPIPILDKYVNYFSIYFNDLSYEGTINMDYRNYEIKYIKIINQFKENKKEQLKLDNTLDSDLDYKYWTINIKWTIEETDDISNDIVVNPIIFNEFDIDISRPLITIDNSYIAYVYK